MLTPTPVLLGGAPEGFDAKLVARELARGVPVVHVARDDKRMEAMRAALTFFAPEAVVLTLPAWDCLPYDRISPNPDLSAARMATLALLSHGVAGPFILLTTVNAATQRLPARAMLREVRPRSVDEVSLEVGGVGNLDAVGDAVVYRELRLL